MSTKLIYLILWSIFLSGCLSTNENSIVPESKIKNDQLQKEKQQRQKKCDEHREMMRYALSYVMTEFEKGYFEHSDIVGAKAQLFLIKNKSQSLFAKNINDAENSYTTQYQLAQKEKCDLQDLSISPLTKVKNTIKVLDDAVSL
ncbi:MAG: hypothetical protein WA945_11500 [Arcobacteraceae bacterium]